MLPIADYTIPHVGVTIVPPTTKYGDQRQAWDRLSEQLRIWSLDPSQLDDDGIPAPTRATLGLALRVAELWKAGGSRAFDRVTPTGDGGIAFTAEQEDELVRLEIDPEGEVEMLHARAGVVSSRLKLLLPIDG